MYKNLFLTKAICLGCILNMFYELSEKVFNVEQNFRNVNNVKLLVKMYKVHK